MIRNVSNKNDEIKSEIASLVGKSYSLLESLKMGGTGSPRFFITDASEPIKLLLDKSNSLNSCNIELRPAGIVVGFRSVLETYSWVIPFYNLRVSYAAEQYFFFSDKDFICVKNNHKDKINKSFIDRMLDSRAKYLQRMAMYN